ncbi:hypothetical protein B0T17DRAFT_381963 [Bombardia bombarda]|uniref:Uncharacterized protein n=1 Tax=Bombardia bombarda TaxID=252184 RepID=A0AA39WH21_9PEZI|nr:hypothetical protein B0T17DRAFT_381963 [Bombardia bombarda]
MPITRPTVHTLRATLALARPEALHCPRHFFLPAMQQRFASLNDRNYAKNAPTSPSGRNPKEEIDMDFDIDDPPEAAAASTAAGVAEKVGKASTSTTSSSSGTGSSNRPAYDAPTGQIIEPGNNKMLYASVGALGLAGLYMALKTTPTDEEGNPRPSAELDPGTDARGRHSITTKGRQHHDLPAHTPGGSNLQKNLRRGD